MNNKLNYNLIQGVQYEPEGERERN